MNQSCFFSLPSGFYTAIRMLAPSLVRTSVSHQRKFNYNSIVSYSRQQASQAAQILATPSRVIRTVDYESAVKQVGHSNQATDNRCEKGLPKIVDRLTVCAQVP
jgi:hypothetical protein